MTKEQLQMELVDAQNENAHLRNRVATLEMRINETIEAEKKLMESVSKDGINILHYERNINTLNEIIKP